MVGVFYRLQAYKGLDLSSLHSGGSAELKALYKLETIRWKFDSPPPTQIEYGIKQNCDSIACQSGDEVYFNVIPSYL